MYSIEIWRQGVLLAQSCGAQETALLYKGVYEEGDEIRFSSESDHVLVQVDQQVKPARMYLPEKAFTYRLPLQGDGLAVYPPQAFGGDMHLISIRSAAGNPYRNLAENPADQRGDVAAYPHATANVETRNESGFAARNVIDGEHIACGHGEWPFGSWGIGARTDAALTLDFGREVEIDTLVLYLRADFPHDAYWISGTVTLDDGFTKTFPLEGIDGGQRIDLGSHKTRTLLLDHLIKCDNPSAFPALRQLEVYGKDIEA